jgi:tetratricopeptide (TPR) repeat protein
MTSRAKAFAVGLAAICVAAGILSPTLSARRGARGDLREESRSTPTDLLIADLQSRLRQEPLSPETWVRLGHAWVRKARETSDPRLYRSAGDAADAALELAPKDARALGLRGLVLLDAHRFEEARQLGEELLRRDPEDLAALALVADAQLELGNFEEAVRATQRMVDLKPSLPSYARASHLMWLAGDVPGALETARLAIQAGGDPEARAWLMVDTALLFSRQGDHDGADSGLDAVLSVMPDYAPALAGKGRVALGRGDPAAAVEWLGRAFARAPLAETAWLLGEARQLIGDRDGARQAYAHVVRFVPRGG